MSSPKCRLQPSNLLYECSLVVGHFQLEKIFLTIWYCHFMICRFPYLNICLLALLVSVLTTTKSKAQYRSNNHLIGNYPFIRYDLNNIDNELQGIKRFYRKLKELENGQIRRVRVVHIGDSHIQADYFPGTVRKALQMSFGVAGRGLVFPYRVAGTNTPSDIYSYSNISWESKRIVYPDKPLPIGISGITIRTNYPEFLLKLDIKENREGINNDFNKVVIFHDKGEHCFDYQVGISDEATVMPTAGPIASPTYHIIKKGESITLIARQYGCTAEQIRMWNNLEGDIIYAGQKLKIKPGGTTSVAGKINKGNRGFKDWIYIDNKSTQSYGSPFKTTLWLAKPVNSLSLWGVRRNNKQRSTTVYGVMLENTSQKGVLYHMVGVNGATYAHYLQAEYFFEQLTELRPDLVIVSLGTNDALNNAYNSRTLEDNISTFVARLNKHVPGADILLTTPADALRGDMSSNRRMEAAASVIRKTAIANGISYWNFFDVMGGAGAMRDWYSNGLAQRDRLHLTMKGYQLQGNLLHDALIKGYGIYHR